jgi:hypothetical protein
MNRYTRASSTASNGSSVYSTVTTNLSSNVQTSPLRQFSMSASEFAAQNQSPRTMSQSQMRLSLSAASGQTAFSAYAPQQSSSNLTSFRSAQPEPMEVGTPHWKVLRAATAGVRSKGSGNGECVLI